MLLNDKKLNYIIELLKLTNLNILMYIIIDMEN